MNSSTPDIGRSVKIRDDDHRTVTELSDRHNVTKLDVFTAAMEGFAALNERTQRARIERVLEKHNRPYRRVGRGNRKTVAA